MHCGKKKDINYKKIRGVNLRKALRMMLKRGMYKDGFIGTSIAEGIANKVKEELQNKQLEPRRIMYERQMLYSKLVVRLVPYYFI
jgi:hypothetical protein